MVVEGFRLVRELLVSNVPVEVMICTEEFLLTQRYQALNHFRKVETIEVTASVFDKISATESPQGVLAVCHIPALSISAKKPLLYVIADQVRDPGNLGTMLRTAWAAGVTAILLLPGASDHTNPKVIRAGMGSHFHVPIIKGDWADVKSLINPTTIWYAEASQGQLYDEVDWREDVTIVIGGEASGVTSKTRQIASPVHIPMHAETESLNAAIACGILLFEATRQRRTI
jgi:TrmH family RNA methyltransferase